MVEKSLDQYLADVGRCPVLPIEEQKALARKAQKGDKEARERLAECNLRFVISQAKKYQYLGLNLSDLVGEGNVGLMRAVDKYNPRKNVKFISYAVWWIRRAILSAIGENTYTTDVPAKRRQEFYKTRRLINQYSDRLQLPESDAMKLAFEKLYPDPVKRQDALERYHELFSMSTGQATHLDDVVGEGDETFAATTPDQKAENSLEQAIRVDNRNLFDSILANPARYYLRPREARILRLYFGFETGEQMTLEAIAKELGVTRQRVTQIRETALSKLRRNYTLQDIYSQKPSLSHP